jgi:protease secretion system outer membrane protein
MSMLPTLPAPRRDGRAVRLAPIASIAALCLAAALPDALAQGAAAPATQRTAAPAASSALAAPSEPRVIFAPADALRAARLADPTFRAAQLERDAGRQNQAIARADLLPSVSASARYGDVGGWRRFDDASGGGTRQDLDFTSSSATLSAKQTLWNPEAMSRARFGEAQAALADASFVERESGLLLRVATAYLDVALAKEDLDLARNQVDALTEQRTAAEQRFKFGAGTRTEVADANARLQKALAIRLDAAGALDVARDTLSKITGVVTADAPRLRTDWPVPPLEPAAESDWLKLALDSSPTVRVQRESVRAAGFEAERTRNARWPKLDLVMSIGRASSDSVATVNQSSMQRIAGLQIAVPLFSGGGLEATETQAALRHAREQAGLEAVSNGAAVEVRRYWLVMRAAAEKLEALRASVESAIDAATGAKAGFSAGTNSFWEVLEAEQRRFVAERDLARAARDVLQGRLQLAAVAGVLDDPAVDALGRYFRSDAAGQ